MQNFLSHLCARPNARLRRRHRGAVVVGLALAVFLVAGCGPRAEAPATASASKPGAPAAAPAPFAVPDSVRKIMGRWLREDGGYVLEIGGGAPGGVLEASYFNPRSIHVSRAAWYESDAKMQVLVQLDDVGYPGATYVLHHDSQTDRLVGEYKQPAMQQSFEIEFVREPKR